LGNQYTDKSCVITIVLVLVAVGSAIIMPIILLTLILMNIELETWNNLSNIAKNIVQLFFFVLTAILAILTYRQAKKSFFSPMKNEIFKRQIEKLEEFKNSFGTIINKNDLIKAFTFEEIFVYNFMKTFAKIKDPDHDPNDILQPFRPSMSIVLMTPENMESRIFPGYFQDKEGKIPSLDLTSNYIRINESLKKITTSNLIPYDIQNSIKEFQIDAENILKKIVEFLESKEDDIKKSDENNIDGAVIAYREFNLNEENLYLKYLDCISKIRDYLNTDKIMN